MFQNILIIVSMFQNILIIDVENYDTDKDVENYDTDNYSIKAGS